ncbi:MULTISPECIES: hypothetical protein [Metabacillus]|nr:MULTISPECIES: hypothetical protein [Metabacillus]MCM3443571.1 hypothetical protein [Metabacillus halosaccharovorans]
MNQTLSTFLKFGITAVCIGLLLFGVGYAMVTDEATNYETEVEGNQALLP